MEVVWNQGYPTKKRNLEIHKAREEGQTFKDIADKYGITSMRVIQIYRKIDRCIKEYGV